MTPNKLNQYLTASKVLDLVGIPEWNDEYMEKSKLPALMVYCDYEFGKAFEDLPKDLQQKTLRWLWGFGDIDFIIEIENRKG